MQVDVILNLAAAIISLLAALIGLGSVLNKPKAQGNSTSFEPEIAGKRPLSKMGILERAFWATSFTLVFAGIDLLLGLVVVKDTPTIPIWIPYCFIFPLCFALTYIHDWAEK